MQQIVGVSLDGSKQTYDFMNKYEFPIKIGDSVICKVGTGGTCEGVIKQIGELRVSSTKGFKNIVEVKKLNISQKPLEEGSNYVCDLRIWRKQWGKDGGYADQWSDLVITCLYHTNENIKIGSLVTYGENKGRVVKLRQMPIKNTAKFITVKLKQGKDSTGVFNKIINMFKR